MTDAEIIKALECCIIGDCQGCIYGGTDQINRQKAEIERLKACLKEKNAEIDRLNVELSARMELEKIAKAEFTLLSAYFQVKSVRAEAIKEFAESLKNRILTIYKSTDGTCVYEINNGIIDDLVKEMTEPSLLDKKFGGDAE